MVNKEFCLCRLIEKYRNDYIKFLSLRGVKRRSNLVSMGRAVFRVAVIFKEVATLLCSSRRRCLFFVFALPFFLGSQAGFALGSNYTVADILERESAIESSITADMKKKKCFRACNGIRQGDTDKKIVALTFDDGPNKMYTEQVLDILRKNDIKAAFFVIGENVKEDPGLVKKIYEEGHIIGNHTYSHARLPKIAGQEIEDEIVKNTNIIKVIIGVEPVFFRPPYGACSAKQERVARNLKLKPIIWSAVTDDYNVDKTSPEKIASEIFSLVKPGAIILMHDGGGNREKTVVALTILIGTLKSEGYQCVSLEELLNIKPYRKNPGMSKPVNFMSLAKIDV